MFFAPLTLTDVLKMLSCNHEHQLDEAEKREGQEPSLDRCSRCDAVISRTRADRFSICETCEGGS
jgi:hypothetical protein